MKDWRLVTTASLQSLISAAVGKPPSLCYNWAIRNIESPMSAANTPPTPPAGNYTAGSWATVEPPARELPAHLSPYSSTYQPTAEQLARDEARRRDLRRNVYAPIIVAIILLVVLLGAVIALAFGAEALGVSAARAAEFVAGLSALVVILFAIPAIVAMSVLPIAWLALRLKRRHDRQLYPETGPMAYRGRVQTWLWQLDSLLDGLRHGVEGVTARLRRPLIAAHVRAAQAQGAIDSLRGKSKRSI